VLSHGSIRCGRKVFAYSVTELFDYFIFVINEAKIGFND